MAETITSLQKKYARTAKYDAEHYDRIGLKVKKGYKEIVKNRADEVGLSVSAYLMSLVDKDINS